MKPAPMATDAPREGDGLVSQVVAAHEPEPARWTRPLVRLDGAWTKVETYLVLGVLIAAILYMTGWVTLNAFHTKGGKLAKFPGAIATFAGFASGIAWLNAKDRKPKQVLVPIALVVTGVTLLLVAHKQDYFANVSRWLSDASLIKQMGTPQIVSARLFTIWVALLGGSLATGAGRQINIDVVMRFIGPKPRLVVALLGYVLASAACFMIAWGFLDYLAITRYGAAKDTKPGEKVALVAKSVKRHTFVVQRQLALDVRSFGKVVLGGQPYDRWYTGAEWNEELNTKGWATVYPPPPPSAEQPAPAIAYPTKPCLSAKEIEDLVAKGGSTNPEWRLPGACDGGDGTTTRAPLATAPEPDDRTPLEADLSLLFPWGFLMIGLRFLLRGALAVGGAVSTDPNAAHGSDGPTHEADMALEPPIVESKVHEEAEAHAGAEALPADDTSPSDIRQANEARESASKLDVAKKAEGGEPPHHHVDDVGDPKERASDGPKLGALAANPTRMRDGDIPAEARPSKPPSGSASSRPPSMPPDATPTAQRLEAAEAIAREEEEERTLVGDLSELARAQEILEQKRLEEEKKKGGQG